VLSGSREATNEILVWSWVGARKVLFVVINAACREGGAGILHAESQPFWCGRCGRNEPVGMDDDSELRGIALADLRLSQERTSQPSHRTLTLSLLFIFPLQPTPSRPGGPDGLRGCGIWCKLAGASRRCARIPGSQVRMFFPQSTTPSSQSFRRQRLCPADWVVIHGSFHDSFHSSPFQNNDRLEFDPVCAC
jgi:hypothetical protein